MKKSEVSSEKAYERLKILYDISKHLTGFESVEITFPKILTCASETFPLLTVVLIEHWEESPHTVVWHSTEATEEQMLKATSHARDVYSYISGASQSQRADIHKNTTLKTELTRNAKTQNLGAEIKQNYIVLPLIVNNLPPLGALQLEGGSALDETDLEFVSALADLVSVALDRFYRTKREQELRKNLQIKIENLENERELREAFVSLLTHDLRTPLSVILGSAQFILRKPDDLIANQRFAEKIVKHVNRVGQMITNLLDANRIHSGEKLPLKREAVNMCSLIEETVAELETIHGDRFIINCAASIDLFCDPSGVRRIIENLCNNAIKYGSPNTPVTLKVKPQEENIQISVHNFGDAISTEDQKSLFEQFRRTQSAVGGTHRGWGIGLTLVRGVAEAHGGSVSVESNPGSGTVFTVTLPKNSSHPGQ